MRKHLSDRYGRTILEAVRYRRDVCRVQIGPLYMEKNYLWDRGVPRQPIGSEIKIGWDRRWLLGQPKLPPSCEKCGRQVPVPCRDAEGFYTGGPWDFSCDMFFNPHKYE